MRRHRLLGLVLALAMMIYCINLPQLTINGKATPADLCGISLQQTELNLAVGETAKLNASIWGEENLPESYTVVWPTYGGGGSNIKIEGTSGDKTEVSVTALAKGETSVVASIYHTLDDGSLGGLCSSEPCKIRIFDTPVYTRIDPVSGSVYVKNAREKGAFALEIEKKTGENTWAKTCTVEGNKEKYDLGQLETGSGKDIRLMLQEHFKETGVYRSKVTVTHDDDSTSVYYSEEFDYNKPSTRVSAPADVIWVIENGSVYAEWDPAEDDCLQGYVLYLYKDGAFYSELATVPDNSYTVSTSEHNKFMFMDNGDYTIRVYALSSDISMKSFSNYAETAVPYKNNEGFPTVTVTIENKGEIKAVSDTDFSGKVDLYLYRVGEDGNEQIDVMYYSDGVFYGEGSTGWLFQKDFTESGMYLGEARITKDDGEGVTRTYTSDLFAYTRPADSLPAPANVRVEEKNGGKQVVWDAVEDAGAYIVETYKNGINCYSQTVEKDKQSLDISDTMTYNGEGNYTFRVYALSDDINTISMSTYTESEAVTYEKPKPPVVAVTGVSLDKPAVTVAEGETSTLTAVITPDNATDKTVTWTVADGKIATVAGGAIKGVAAGKTTVTVKTTDGEKTATADVTVIHATPKAAYATGKLTGLVPGAAYLVNGKTSVTAAADGTVTVDDSWYNSTISIVRINADAALNSAAQSLAIPAASGSDEPEPVKPAPYVPEEPDKTKEIPAVTKTFGGREATVKLDVTYKSALLYTGKPATPKQLGIEVNTADFEKLLAAAIEGNKKGIKAQKLYSVSYVSNKKKTVGSKATMYGKIKFNDKKAKKAGLGKQQIAELKALVKDLNKNLKNNKAEYEIKPINLSDPSYKVEVKAKLKKGKIKVKNGKLKDIKSVKVTTPTKTFTISSKQYSIDIVDAETKKVKVTGKGNFTGTSLEVTVKK